MTYETVEKAARESGLIAMGAQHPDKSRASQLNGGTLILLGAGEGFWSVLNASPEWLDGSPDPVDRWSLRVIGQMSETLGARAYFPFGGPPYTPFIDWALKSGRAFQSPVGAMVHDTVGMLISYRGALHFEQEMKIPDANGSSPCINCEAPCSTACPVGALSTDKFYDLDACHSFLDTPAGQSCMSDGCAARLACPVSAGAARNPEQSAHHMKAFHPI